LLIDVGKNMSAEKPISRIATLRDKAGLTQLELAQKVKVTETTIANWEKGRSGTDWFERIIRLCDALHCAAKDLVEYQPTSEPEVLLAKGLSLPEVQELLRDAQPGDLPFNAPQDSQRIAANNAAEHQEA
jgi:transcriptional regulator with XRE-family HTH domain